MRTHPPKSHPAGRRGHRRLVLAGVGTLALFTAVGIGISVAGDEGPPSADRIVPTGEVSAMGTPVIETPGSSTGTAVAGPVEVIGASWALGTVPLDVTVRPSWTLHNTSDEPVFVGQPHPKVREGCCPGAFDIDTTTIGPGETATLGFELSMHTGMEGWHDIAIHIPLRSGSTDHVLELEVNGDFAPV